jgi:hypothetical protein
LALATPAPGIACATGFGLAPPQSPHEPPQAQPLDAVGARPWLLSERPKPLLPNMRGADAELPAELKQACQFEQNFPPPQL